MYSPPYELTYLNLLWTTNKYVTTLRPNTVAIDISGDKVLRVGGTARNVNTHLFPILGILKMGLSLLVFYF